LEELVTNAARWACVWCGHMAQCRSQTELQNVARAAVVQQHCPVHQQSQCCSSQCASEWMHTPTASSFLGRGHSIVSKANETEEARWRNLGNVLAHPSELSCWMPRSRTNSARRMVTWVWQNRLVTSLTARRSRVALEPKHIYSIFCCGLAVVIDQCTNSRLQASIAPRHQERQPSWLSSAKHWGRKVLCVHHELCRPQN